MKHTQALEMAEALGLGNEHGITTLGVDGDEIALHLWLEIETLRQVISVLSSHQLQQQD